MKTRARNLVEGIVETIDTQLLSEAERAKLVEARKRYDNVANWMRLLIGYTWSQIDEAIGSATDKPTRASVEACVEKIENDLTAPSEVENFFHDHDHSIWYTAQSEAGGRRIHATPAEKPENFGVGEQIHHINDQFPDPTDTAETDHTAAEAEFVRCVTTEFDKAWKAKERELITHRTVTIPDPPTPPPADDE